MFSGNSGRTPFGRTKGAMEGTMEGSTTGFVAGGGAIGRHATLRAPHAGAADVTGAAGGRDHTAAANDHRDVGRLDVDLDAALDVDNVEQWVETDPALAPTGRSALLVEPAVLDPEEVDALLADLGDLLAAASSDLTDPALIGAGAVAAAGGRSDLCSPLFAADTGAQGASHEPNASSARRTPGHSKLSPFAWLFPDHAGTGRPARHEQGHHLRARRRAGKKARPAAGQAQGSLFGDRG